MCTISNCEIIVTCIQNVISCCSSFICCRAVPACHILCICCDCYCCGFTWCKLICLLVVKKLDCCLLYQMFFIIIGIRSRSVKLYYIFPCYITCVCYCHLCCDFLILKIYIQAVQSLCKCCIGKSIAKWIRNLTVICPCAACGATYTVGCISLSKNCIRITCLIVFVSCVNPLCLHNLRVD